MKAKTITENRRKFHKLLAWLEKDSKSAAQKYESIRQTLTEKLSAKGCCEAEELADETIDRVTNKIDVLVPTYVGDPRLYFFGVAKNVYLEFTRRPTTFELKKNTIAQKPKDFLPVEEQSQCLDKCLDKLSVEDSKLVIEYYKRNKPEKIKHRKQMAEKLGVSMQALRVRVFRLRKSLQKCFLETSE